MKKRPKFPREIFIRYEDPGHGEEPFMVADPGLPGGEDGDKVAIYELKTIKTKRITEELV